MDLLIAILLYLGALNPTQQYSTTDVYSVAKVYQDPVMQVSTDTTQMRIVNDYYLSAASTLELSDRVTGN